MEVDISPINKVFLAIRNGSLGSQLSNFTTEDLQPFLPLLIHRFFVDSKDAGYVNKMFESQQLDEIRARLIGSMEGNEIMALYKLNYDDLQSKFVDVKRGQQSHDETEYSLLSLEKKVLLIGSHLINKVKNQSNTMDSFVPFDFENHQEEIVWIISLLCILIPPYFNVVEVSSSLLSYTYGQQILFRVLLNHPAFIDQVVDKILSIDNLEGHNAFMRRRKDTIMKILQLDPDQTKRIFKTSLEIHSRLRLCVDILCSDLVDDQFFVSTVFSRIVNEKGVFCQFLIKNSNKDFTAKIRTRFNKILLTHNQMESEFKERVVLLMALFANYNFLRLLQETTREWVRFLTDQTGNDLRLVKIVLAVILACPNLLPANQQAFRDEEVEQRLVEYFCWVREMTDVENSSEYGPLNRFMLLVAIHMKTNNGEELSKLLSDELSFNVGDTLRKHITVKRLFLGHAMPETVIAKKAISLGVTKNLDNNFAGYLPVHCVNHLLIARTFAKHQILIQDWIKRQLRECQLPIHPYMVHVLENFAISCFPTTENPDYNEQIDEDFFWEIFSTDLFSDDKVLARKVLALLYLLAFTRRYDTSPPIANTGTKKAPKPYSDRLWAEIPIRYILSVTDARPSEFESDRVNLLYYIGTIMPHMLPTLDAIVDGTEAELALKTAPVFNSIPKGMFTKALENIRVDLQSFSKLVDYLQTAPIQEQHSHHETVISSMQVSLDGTVCPLAVTFQLAKIWKRLANLIPRKLFEQTLELWLNTPFSATHGTIKLDNSTLLKEVPSLMFRVDDRIFKSPPHFEMLLQILSFYLDATKNYNNDRLVKAAAMQETKQELDEKNMLIKSYTGAQHLAVVQFLLDICNSKKYKGPNSEEICNIACAHIHQMFVADLALPKLVHFNMYPVNLIPMVVKKVPSMHVLITSIAELVIPAHLERRIFAINLVAELAEKYTVPSALSAVEFVEDVLLTLLESTIDEHTIVLFLNIVGALHKFMKFGPPHQDVVESLLQRVRTISRSRCALYRSDVAEFVSPERQLISKIDTIIQ